MRKSSTFMRVIRSYSLFEKIISVILVVLFLYLGGIYLIDKFSFGSTVAKKGIYTEGFSSGIFNINPVYADLNEPDRDVSTLVFTGLMKYDPETKKIVSDMADVVISEDKLTYTFTLHHNILWHDNEVLDAGDVYFTYHDVIQNPDFQNPVLKANFEGVEINLIDNNNIEFKLSAPNSFFITNLTVGLLPEHILKAVPVVDLYMHEFNRNPVGTGPYKIKTPLTTGNSGVSQVLLEQYDSYYGLKPQIEQVRFYGYPSRAELIANKNSLNAIPKLTEESIGSVKEDTRFSLYGYSLPQYNAVFINMDNSILKSLKVRQALQKAIYKDAFLEQLPDTIRVETPVMSLNQDDYRFTANMDEAKKLLEDAGYDKFYIDSENITEDFVEGEESTTSETAGDAETASSDDTPAETTSDTTAGTSVESEPDSSVSETDTPAISNSLTVETEDTSTTSEETTVSDDTIGIEESIMTDDGRRKYRKNIADQPLELRLIARLYPETTYKYTETQTVIKYLEENWGEAGIKLNVELYDSATLQQKIQARDYDLLLFGQGLGYNLDLYGYFHSTQSGENGLNFSNYKSFKVDTLIEGIRNTFNDDEKQEKFEEMAKVIQDDIPAIFLYRPLYYYASDLKVQGIELENVAYPRDRFCKIDEWYFD